MLGQSLCPSTPATRQGHYNLWRSLTAANSGTKAAESSAQDGEKKPSTSLDRFSVKEVHARCSSCSTGTFMSPIGTSLRLLCRRPGRADDPRCHSTTCWVKAVGQFPAGGVNELRRLDIGHRALWVYPLDSAWNTKVS